MRPSLLRWSTVLLSLIAHSNAAGVSSSGGAGHALLFHDHGVVLRNFKDFPSTEMTFEAWVSTSDYCHASTLMSYALDSHSSDEHQQVSDFNHFVIFDLRNILACHDFEYIDLWPDPEKQSCNSAFNRTDTASVVERDPIWHHLAVTWTQRDNGMTKIYLDGLIMAETPSKRTSPLRSGGALMLGGEQDCYGGCTDAGQGYYGLLDEVRIWNRARSQEEILTTMRVTSLKNEPNLVAYWQFNDPDEHPGVVQAHLVAKDSSGHGNDLPLINPPTRIDDKIEQGGKHFDTSALSFQNNYALATEITNMPTRDLTVEFWGRTPKYENNNGSVHQEFLSFATHLPGEHNDFDDSIFVDDAILIEKYMEEFGKTRHLYNLPRDFKTLGSVSVHINANRQGNGNRFDHWLDYALDWTDNNWHHLAVTWRWDDGETQLYFDGNPQTPFWRSDGGMLDNQDPGKGGVEKKIGGHTSREGAGALVLGQQQECYGGCFSPEWALDGDMANVRIWDRVLSQDDIKGGMFSINPSNTNGLQHNFHFSSANVKDNKAKDTQGNAMLDLWADAPRWEYSTAPLADANGRPLDAPQAGAGGSAMYLSDQQVLMLSNFKNFPTKAITVEFWMWSVDACRQGTPFSYATGGYNDNDNTFLLFNYQNWGVSVLEDEGTYDDHRSGIASTDGQWHHIAVTWSSSDGQVNLYDNGRKVWTVTRSKGKEIPSGGTLVIGREQDCQGGCFDSMVGGKGKVDPVSGREYGPQDFFGVIDEMRIWKTVRTPKQIEQSMAVALHRTGTSGGHFNDPSIKLNDPDLVAYWNFDEGQGYQVKDQTSNGHHLHAANMPQWQVVRWLSVCGDGVIEGVEECDDGNTKSGDGCSAFCQVEDNFECDRENPSHCWHSQGARHTHAEIPQDATKGGGTSSSSSGSGTSAGRITGIVVGTAVGILAAGIAVLAWVKRDVIFDAFPMLDDALESLRSRLRGDGGGSGPRFAGLDTLDPEENLELAPDFVSANRGRYETLPGGRQNGL
ncbi:hypothetical protein WJX74_002134 [Apatococcus lobatus]|uniref:Pentraxin (PTX) domain-containing protein n=2 Tax=Apatococcus TaxID=904362 RepID=A0AAW1SDQ1_9CHLO